jgi:S1-C subfamily serine protease
MGDMITDPFPYEPPELPEAPAGAAPSPAGGDPRRPMSRTAIAVAALFVIGGIGGGALGAQVILSRTPAPTAVAVTRSTSTSSLPQAQTPSSAPTIYQQAVPGVVTITTESAGRFGRVGEGTGSGIVLNTNGYILTNAHVVAGATQLRVTFNDGRTLPATLVSSNTSADLAVIQVSAAASTEGIVSGLNRNNTASGLSGLIQTDAPINPGNSGGALLNTQGQVIGINDSIESPIAGNVGVGFAIPVNVVKQLLSSLEGGANQ